MDFHKYCYKTLISLLHPAFLGAVIVGLVNSILNFPETASLKQMLFAIIETLFLILYFVLDYWVALYNGSRGYKFWNLAFDLVVLTAFYVSISSLWRMTDVSIFFFAVLVIFLTYLVQDVIVKRRGQTVIQPLARLALVMD
jgi:hypothetical protein